MGNSEFEVLKNEADKKLQKDREARKEATARLRASGQDTKSVEQIKSNLKNHEFEIVARHIEDVADKFVEYFNSLFNTRNAVLLNRFFI